MRHWLSTVAFQTILVAGVTAFVIGEILHAPALVTAGALATILVTFVIIHSEAQKP